MKHPYDEAAGIVDRFIPRHILAVDRARLRDAIYQAIVERHPSACGIAFTGYGGGPTHLTCNLPARHKGPHMHRAGPLSGLRQPAPHEQPVVDEDRCGWQFGETRCERVADHGGDCIFNGKRYPRFGGPQP